MSMLHQIVDHQKQRDQQIKVWMKPRIKREAGAWLCTGRGTTVKSYCPRAAYDLWLFALQPKVIYAVRRWEGL